MKREKVGWRSVQTMKEKFEESAILVCASFRNMHITRGRSKLIAVAIYCWYLQVFESADLIFNSAAIAFAIPYVLTALKLV